MMLGGFPQAQDQRNELKKVGGAAPQSGPPGRLVQEATAPPLSPLSKADLPTENVLIRVSSTPGHVKIELAGRTIGMAAWSALGLVTAVVAFRIWLFRWRNKRWPKPWSRLSIVKGKVSFAGIGEFEINPNTEDLQIAHRIWTELKTRKAALPFDAEHDVIIEVYDSWYALFGKTRDLLANIPANLIRQDHSTREIVRISLAVLNDGLRPHLTRWQARYRNWYGTQKKELEIRSPQEVQKSFPDFAELIEDLKKVNAGLVEYADQLARLTHM